MEKRTHADRFKVNCEPAFIESFGNGDGPWSEDEAQVAAGLAWGEEKARLLKWVRRQMKRRLTVKQRQYIELYYFRDMTYAEIGKMTGCAPSSACRSVHRAIKCLRAAAQIDPPAHLRVRKGAVVRMARMGQRS